MTDIAAQALAVAQDLRTRGRDDAAREIEACVRSWPSTTEALLDLHDTLLLVVKNERSHVPRARRREIKRLARETRIRTGLVPGTSPARILLVVVVFGIVLCSLFLLLPAWLR